MQIVYRIQQEKSWKPCCLRPLCTWRSNFDGEFDMFLLAGFQIRQKQWIFTLQSNIHESWTMIGHRARKFYKEVIFVREKYKYFPLFCLGEINLRKKVVNKNVKKNWGHDQSGSHNFIFRDTKEVFGRQSNLWNVLSNNLWSSQKIM